jgi:hypothetical protein
MAKAPTQIASTVKKVNLTGFQLNVLHSVMTSPQNRGFGIKDLRLIKSVSDHVAANQIKINPPPAKDTTKTDEENAKVQQAYVEEAEKLMNSERPVAFSDFQFNFIKSRIEQFPNFVSYPEYLDKIIDLADKFGVKA